MPKRIVDGDGVWNSQKIRNVQPLAFRAEFANLIPLAFANGSFEADPDLIWKAAYAYNRPEIAREAVAQILDEFERVGLLFRWNHEGKTWGYWVGIEKKGRLPGKSRWGKNEKIGAELPVEACRKHLESIGIHWNPNGSQTETDGSEKLLGFGSGSGLGNGLGSGSGLDSNRSRSSKVEQGSNPLYESEDFDLHEWCLKTFRAFPGFDAKTVPPPDLSHLYQQIIEREAPARGGCLAAAQWFLEVVEKYAASDEVARGYGMRLEKFLREGYSRKLKTAEAAAPEDGQGPGRWLLDRDSGERVWMPA